MRAWPSYSQIFSLKKASPSILNTLPETGYHHWNAGPETGPAANHASAMRQTWTIYHYIIFCMDNDFILHNRKTWQNQLWLNRNTLLVLLAAGGRPTDVCVAGEASLAQMDSSPRENKTHYMKAAFQNHFWLFWINPYLFGRKAKAFVDFARKHKFNKAHCRTRYS